jgi:hypothetical protein
MIDVFDTKPNPGKGSLLHLHHLHLSHLADALIQSDLQIGAFTL